MVRHDFIFGRFMNAYISHTSYLDFNHSSVVDFSAKYISEGMSDSEKAIALYYGVRDDIKYNPYSFNVTEGSFKASHCAQANESYCVPKAVLLVALCRLNGIPARLGLADVKNHLSSPALIEWLQNDEFVMHGYADIQLNGKWVKATPAFDKRLCKHMGVLPLEFDGTEDSIFHEYNGEGERAMEYLRQHGEFEDVPYDFIIEGVQKAYPHLTKFYKENGGAPLSKASLEKDLGI